MVMKAASEGLLDISSALSLSEVVLVNMAIEALYIALGLAHDVALIEGACGIEFIAKTVVGDVNGTEDETTAVYLYAHLLAEGTSHEEAVKVATSVVFVGERREVHVLKGATLNALLDEEQGL